MVTGAKVRGILTNKVGHKRFVSGCVASEAKI